MSTSASIVLPSADTISKAALALRRGELVAFPTETVYGLGGDACNPQALSAIYRIKRRPAGHPLIVHIAHIKDLSEWARDIPDYAWELAERFCPGPISLVLRRSPKALDILTGGQDTVAIRIPKHPVALALLSAFGSGIAAPSANVFGYISPSTAQHVQKGLGNAITWIIDGGACELGIESSIIDCTGKTPALRRPGAISLSMIEDALSKGKKTRHAPVVSKTKNTLAEINPVPVVPGSTASHYAPHTPCQLIAREDIAPQLSLLKAKRVALLSPHPPDRLLANSLYSSLQKLYWYAAPDTASAYAHHLYAYLHDMDTCGAEIILIETPPLEQPDWWAIHDRLKKACYRS